jgi:hypothetical protein
MNKNILISIPFAVSLRNIMGSSFCLGNSDCKYIIITSFSKKTINSLKKKFKKYRFYKYPFIVNVQKIIFSIYRCLVTAKNFDKKKDKSMHIIRERLNNNYQSIYKEHYFANTFIFKFLSKNLFFFTISKIILELILYISSINYIYLIIKYNPREVFFAHAHTNIDKGLFYLCRILKIKTYALISSWDNLTSKTFLPIKYDKIFVWNKIIEEEAIKKGYNPNNIQVIGIPQYDIFKNFIPKKYNFFIQNKIKNNYKIITYMSASKVIYVNKDHLKILDSLVNLVKKNKNWILIVRAHPNEQHIYNNYRFPDRVFLNSPSPIQINNTTKININEFVDYEYCSILKKSDVIITMASTTNLEALFYKKPIININFFNKKSLNLNYNLEHYQKLKEFNAIPILSNISQVEKIIKFYFKKKTFKRKERIEARNTFIGNFNPNSGLLIKKYLEK